MEYITLVAVAWAAPKGCGKVEGRVIPLHSALLSPHLECCIQLWMQLSCWADFIEVEQHSHLQTVGITLPTALEARLVGSWCFRKSWYGCGWVKLLPAFRQLNWSLYYYYPKLCLWLIWPEGSAPVGTRRKPEKQLLLRTHFPSRRLGLDPAFKLYG